MDGDIWSDWLNGRRFGGDDAVRATVAAETARFVAKLLDVVALEPGAALLDLGCGTGLVGLAALTRQPSLRVTFCDVSAPLLAQAEAAVSAAECRFVLATATELRGVADASQHVVAARAVLAYVDDRAAAFGEIFRVLKPGGWLSVAEPVWHDEAVAVAAMRAMLSNAPNPALARRVAWKQAQLPESSPLANYTERDLLMLTRLAGFGEVHVRLEIDVEPAPPMGWATFCALSPHPYAPTLAEILTREFTPEEQAALEAELRPAVEAGTNMRTQRVAYVWARKPA
jgi:ubiquinone/menaquinone biosynthesis C-methylase UbiE